MSCIQTLQAINNIDDDILDELLASLDYTENTPKRNIIRVKIALCVIAAVVAALTLAAAATFLFSPGWWTSPQPIPDEHGLFLEKYMSKNTGLIAEDDFVRIEAAGSMRDGNAVMMGFLVTMKQMDSAVIEGSIFTIPGYHFNHCLVRGLGIEGRWGCFYSDTITGLQENQFLYRYTLTEDEPISDEITVELRDIGYINEDGKFTTTLEGTWEWTFQYGDTPSGMQSDLPEFVTAGQRRYTVEKAEVSMFGIELVLRPEPDSSALTETEFTAERNAMLDEIKEALTDVIVHLKGGTEPASCSLSGGGYTSRGGPGYDAAFRFSILFPQPIPTEQIQSITMLDGQIKFTN